MNENYVNYLPESFADELESRREQYMEHYREQGGAALSEMAQIAHKEAKAGNGAYLRFGPYWWALKQVLIESGLLPDSMTTDDVMVKSIYSGDDEIDTLILAFIFRDMYDNTLFQGTREFITGEDGFSYQLFDEDIELSGE